MRAVLIGGLVVLVLCIGGLLVAPMLIDWNFLKPAEPIGIGAGLRMAVDGDIQLRLLPRPAVVLTRVRVINPVASIPPGANQPDLARIQRVSLALDPLALLSGNLRITRLTLNEPVVELTVLADGRHNWPDLSSLIADQPGAGLRSADQQGGEVKLSIAGRRIGLSIPRATIRGGRILYRTLTATETADAIEATLGLGSLNGPFTLDGGARIDGRPMAVRATIGAASPGRPVPFQLTIEQPTAAARLVLNGEIAEQADGYGLSGKLTAVVGEVGRLLDGLGIKAPAALGQRLELAADLKATTRLVEFAGLSIDFGATHGTGRMTVDTVAGPAIDLALQVNRIDLDRWLAPPSGTIDQTTPGALPPLPPSLRVNLDLGAQIVSWRGALASQSRLNAVLDHGVIEVNQATSLLPGGADVMVAGRIGGLDSDPVFDGDVEAEADNLRAILDWLHVDTGTVSPDRLRKASLSSQIKVDRTTVEIAGLDLQLDGSRFRGAATVALRDRPAVGLRLTVDQVNLDAYLGAAGADRLTTLPVLPALDLNLDLTAGTMILRGEPIQAVHLAGALQDDIVTLREAKAGDVAGAAVTLAGTLARTQSGPPNVDGTIEVTGKELARLLRWIDPTRATVDTDAGAFRLAGHLVMAAGTGTALDADLAAIGGSAHLILHSDQAAEAWLGGTGRFDGRLTLRAPSATALAALIRPTYRLAGGELGPAALDLHATGDLTAGTGQVTLDDLSVAAGPQTLKGTATVTLGGVRPRVAANLTVGSIAIERFLRPHRVASAGPDYRVANAAGGIPSPVAGGIPNPAEWTTDPFDLAVLSAIDGTVHLVGGRVGYRRWGLDQPDISATLEDRRLTVGSLAGRVDDGPVEGTLTLDATGVPQAALNLTLKDVRLGALSAGSTSRAPLDGRLAGTIAVTATGASEADMVQTLSGMVNATAHDGVLYGLGLAAVIAQLTNLHGPQDLLGLPATLVAGDSTTPFSTIEATARIDKGIVRAEDLHLLSTVGEGHGAVTVDLPAYTVAGHMRVQPSAAPSLPPVDVAVEGSLDKPAFTVDARPFQTLLAVPGAVGRAIEGATPNLGRIVPSIPKPTRSFDDTLKSLLPGH
ncbi:MAG TPA: AsmA family protein [Stellaceae bacterium]|nr:AsmA family protein [Stellaceae bacterium]